MENFAKKYLEEATEIISSLESLILQVEADSENPDKINEVFRLLHTLKGGGAMFGFTNISEVTHELESVYDLIRTGKASVTSELLNHTFLVIDYVKMIISNKEINKNVHSEKVDSLKEFKENFIKSFKNGNGKKIEQKIKIDDKKEDKTDIIEVKNEIKTEEKTLEKNKTVEVEKNKTPNQKNTKETEEEFVKNLEKKHTPQIKTKNLVKTYRVFFKPNENILQFGTDPLLLIRELTEAGISKVFSVLDFVPTMDNLIYDKTYLAWIVYIVVENKNLIDDVFIFVEDDSIIDIEEIYVGNVFEDTEFIEKLNSIFISDKNELVKKYNMTPYININTKKYENNLLNNIKKSEINNENIKSFNTNNSDSNEFNIKKIEDEKNDDDSGFGFFDDLDKIIEDNITAKKVENEIILDNIDLEDDYNELELSEKSIHKSILPDSELNFSKKDSTITTLRVSSEKVDMLMNLVSELITTQARLTTFSDQMENPELEVIAENINKISRQLRDNAFELSMVPLQSVVIRFQRLVRDLSAQLGKDVDFKTHGTSTEIDKRIIENLIDPIMHMLRNSIDHGLETVNQRSKTKKPTKGTVYLNAFYSGTNVYIQVGDDGKGIDIEKLKSDALAKGFLKTGIIYTNEEIYQVLFEPGFSTSKNVSEVSGRGVGLDVVKRKVSELRGEITVESNIGVGTVFTIKLPLTLSIIDGLLVYIGADKYVVPMNVVNKIYEIKHSDLAKSHYNILTLDKQQIPYYYLRDEFAETLPPSETEQVLIINKDDKNVGIVVDKVIGEYQAVLKPLGKMYSEQQIFSGATILGDGTVALVMDVQRIVDNISIS